MKWADGLLSLIAIIKTLVLMTNEARLRGEGMAEAFGRISQEALSEVQAMHQRVQKAGSDFDRASANGGVPVDMQYRD